MKTIVHANGFPDSYAHFRYPQWRATHYSGYSAPPPCRSGNKRIEFVLSRPRLRPAVRAWASGSSGKLNDGKMNAAKGFALVAWHFSNRHRLLPPPHVVKITNSRNICSAAPKHSLQGRSAHAIRATLRQTAMILAQKKTARRGGLLPLLTWGNSISRTLECAACANGSHPTRGCLASSSSLERTQGAAGQRNRPAADSMPQSRTEFPQQGLR